MVLNKLVRKAAATVGVSFVLGQIRAAAEGRLGSKWKERYWALAGVKTWTGLAFALAAVVLAATGYQEFALYVGAGAGFLVQAGILDKAWRGEIPEPLRQSAVYRFLAGNAELVTALFGSAAAAVTQYEGPEQKVYFLILAGVAAVAVQFGLLDAAWRARGPLPLWWSKSMRKDWIEEAPIR